MHPTAFAMIAEQRHAELVRDVELWRLASAARTAGVTGLRWRARFAQLGRRRILVRRTTPEASAHNSAQA